ncbi:EpsG family protein [Halomonas litopenaei]|uniref:EpsG family protein n=1 Tax=Halomonas litopenaei TaxID=2109328 RepID=UPI001A8E2C06|nr:EpsG family protein [Halomonas litopenaei]MBN8410992.1 EpsG family protein [Halomonas litopenaei]
MTSLLKITKYVVRVLLLLLLFPLLNYDSSLNPDIGNYEINYEKSKWSYDIGFEIVGALFRHVLDFSFEQYWISLLVIVCLLLAALYRNLFVFLLAYPNIIFQATFLGTQIRFAIAILVFLNIVLLAGSAGKSKLTRLCGLAVAASMHFSIVFYYIFYRIYLLIVHKIKGFSVGVRFSLVALVVSVAAVFGSYVIAFAFQVLAEDNYIGSAYFERKSFVSTIYVLCIFCLMWLALKDYIRESRNSANIHTIVLALFLAAFVIGSSSVALLSGRTLILLSFVEPIAIYALLRSESRFCMWLGVVYLMIYLSKNLLGIIYA